MEGQVRIFFTTCGNRPSSEVGQWATQTSSSAQIEFAEQDKL